MHSRLLPIVLATLLLGACESLPLQPTAAQRSELRKIVVVPDKQVPQTHFATFASSPGEGAAKGAGAGALGSVGYGAMFFGPIGVVLGLMLAPVAAVGGAIAGAMDAVPEETARTIGQLQARSAGNPRIQIDLAHRVASEAGRCGYSDSVLEAGDGTAPDDADALLYTAIKSLGLRGSGRNPPLALFIEAESTLLARHEQRLIGRQRFQVASETHSLSDWETNDAELLRNTYGILERRLAEEIFEWQVLAKSPFAPPGPDEVASVPPHPLSPGAFTVGRLFTKEFTGVSPELRWEPSQPPAEKYDLCISRLDQSGPPGGLSCIYRRLELTGTSHRVEQPLPTGGPYQWRVRTANRRDGHCAPGVWRVTGAVFHVRNEHENSNTKAMPVSWTE